MAGIVQRFFYFTPHTATPGVKSIDSYAGLLNGKIIATAPSLENGPFFSFCFSLPFKKVQGENVSPVLPS